MKCRLESRKIPEKEVLPQEKNPADAVAYLSDESRLPGRAEKIFFPQSEGGIAAILHAAKTGGKSVTVSGGRTGIAGGAVPGGGWLMSVEKMNRVLGLRFDEKRDCFFLRCQPGTILEALNRMIAEKHFESEDSWPPESKAALELFRKPGKWRFAPDPTEGSAAIGGMIACNASGARTFHYGPTRAYVEALRLVLAEGVLLDIRRNQSFAAPDGSFTLVLPDGRERPGKIPSYRMPAVKNAAGYFAKPGMDLLDLFVGSEGTLGIVTEAELMLVKEPEMILGVIGFFPSEENALDFVRAARGEKLSGHLPLLGARPLAIEYFDYRALNLLREQKLKLGSSAEIPTLPEKAHTAVYIELPATEEEMENRAEELMALLEACGSSADTAWTALTPEETERLKKFRHALPEAVNQRIGERAAACPGLTKLGTDFAAPDAFLAEMFRFYRRTLDEAKLEYVIFGHVGNNHVHINILPGDTDEYRRGKELYLWLARTILKWGGTVSAEHGIGKLKKPFLALMFGEEGIAEMRRVKKTFDPEDRINPGNMF
ncbi:MAG: FAD-binding oxidoreductase [Kiritimatiellae bacterium]|nr:FAD-binding oxidoreductase [Kiritimatiellia bacterium]